MSGSTESAKHCRTEIATAGQNKNGLPMVIPCIDCGRTGITYASFGLCATCKNRAWRKANAERARELTRLSKQRHRAVRRAQARALARAAGVRILGGDVVAIVCVECGTRLLEPSPSGACNFCIEEQAD